MKYSTKSEFQNATDEQWDQLWQLVDSDAGRNMDRKSGQALKQILAHLYAWHCLFIGWYRTGKSGRPELPAKGFKWQQTRALNQKLDQEYEGLTMAAVRRRLKLSHNRVMKIVDSLDEEQFSQSGHFDWTGKNAISSYIVPNTVSHYLWAIKKIKARLRQRA